MYNKKLIQLVDSLELKFPKATISRELNVSKGTVSSYLNGKIKASRNFLDKFAKFYNFNIDNLLDDDDTLLSLEKHITRPLTQKEIEFVRDAVVLNEEQLLKDKFFNQWLENKLNRKEIEIRKLYDPK